MILKESGMLCVTLARLSPAVIQSNTKSDIASKVDMAKVQNRFTLSKGDYPR